MNPLAIAQANVDWRLARGSAIIAHPNESWADAWQH
jgi:hypothetical protein